MRTGMGSTLVDSRKGSARKILGRAANGTHTGHDTGSVDTGAYRAAETGLDTVWFRDSEEKGDCVQGLCVLAPALGELHKGKEKHETTRLTMRSQPERIRSLA
jgi:hypothetical protein